MAFFPKAQEMDLPALIFMALVYIYILVRSSHLIGEGSEMLLLLYGPGIIGGIIIPIVNVFPDCLVILISGLGNGSQEEIEHEFTVGVGTLVGSTVLLMTLRWAIGIYLGRRDIDLKSNKVSPTEHEKPKVTHFSLRSNGVSIFHEIPQTTKVMLLSSLSYLVIQIPALIYRNEKDHGARKEAPFALTGLIISFLAFISYCYYQYSSTQRSEIIKLQQEQIRRDQWKKNLDNKLTSEEFQEVIFRKHDRDNNGFMDAAELKTALAEMGFNSSRSGLKKLLGKWMSGMI